MTDFTTTARLVAEIDGLAIPTSREEINDRLRRISLARHVALQRCDRLEADVQRVKDELHRLRNEDAAKLGASELAALRLRQGIDEALAVFHDDALPCEEACHQMAEALRSAVAAAEAST
jgi:hypothetical protein